MANDNIYIFIGRMPNAANILPESAFGKMVFLIICILILVYLFNQIKDLMKYGCGRHAPALMIEQFGAEYDSSTKYYKNLNKRLDALDDRIVKSTKRIDKIDSTFTSFQADICYILNQVDDGIEGNYSSSVPEEEFKMTAEEQNKRAKERRAKGKIYVKNLKAAFIESRDKTPMLECFADMSDSEKADLKDKRSTLVDRVNEVRGNLKGLKGTLAKLKNSLSDKQIAMYYVTLQYNDKYLKQMLEEMTKKKEGFEDLPVEPVQAPSPDPADLIEGLETEYKPIDEEIKTINAALTKFIKITSEQKVMLKKTKAIGTDEKYQKETMNSSYSQMSKKPPA
jgi:chromosome segregation ATPase